MRIGNLKGLYLQYRDVAEPVETVERHVYAFPKEKDRTCLVENTRHAEILLQTGRYQVVAVEVSDAPVSQNGDLNSSYAKIDAEIKTPKHEPRKPGRPRKVN